LEASQKRSAGVFDPYLKERFEEVWGEENEKLKEDEDQEMTGIDLEVQNKSKECSPKSLDGYTIPVSDKFTSPTIQSNREDVQQDTIPIPNGITTTKSNQDVAENVEVPDFSATLEPPV
jgi:hypothetical protein